MHLEQDCNFIPAESVFHPVPKNYHYFQDTEFLRTFTCISLSIISDTLLEVFQGGADMGAKGFCKEVDGFSIKDRRIRKNAKPSVSNHEVKES